MEQRIHFGEGKNFSTSELLNLEVFCDTQGHIRVRPPQYNKMPGSVFYRMMYLETDIKHPGFPRVSKSIIHRSTGNIEDAARGDRRRN